MPFVRVVKVMFDTPLKSSEIPAFRGAVVNLVGKDKVLFHNHLGDDKFHYGYPLIQYQSFNRKAGIVSVHYGSEELHHVFENNFGTVSIGGDVRPLYVESVKINRFDVQVAEKQQAYRIKSWLPLNEGNYLDFKKLDSLSEKVTFLEKVLVGNILSFAKGIQWSIAERIQLNILELTNTYPIYRKGNSLLAFDLDFKTNVQLPHDIGLGKGVSIGFGKISPLNKNKA